MPGTTSRNVSKPPAPQLQENADAPAYHDGARRNLWSLSDAARAVVAGRCFSLSEVRGFAHRADDTATDSDLLLRRSFVAEIGQTHSALAAEAQQLLDGKFTSEIARVESIRDTADLQFIWQRIATSEEPVNTENTAGILWAIFTHPLCTTSLMDSICTDVLIMPCIDATESQMADGNLPAIKHELAELRQKLLRQKLSFSKRLQSYRYEVVRLENVNRLLSDRLSTANETVDISANLLSKEDSDRLQCMLRDTSHLLRVTREQLHEERAQAQQQRQQLETQKNDNARLENLISHLVSSDEDPASVCDQSISGKCVLLLGGKPSQCKHFKAYVESNNGDFLHHDGSVEEDDQQIDQMVNRADAVVCPMEQTSHTAISRARTLCAQSETPLVFLPKSSLSAFVSGIRSIQ